jgi:hypothetical protein
MDEYVRGKINSILWFIIFISVTILCTFHLISCFIVNNDMLKTIGGVILGTGVILLIAMSFVGFKIIR